jgi:serine/threonine protein kinase
MYKTKKQKKSQKSKKKTIKLKKKGGSVEIIGRGSFGCAFSKDSKPIITKIGLYNQSNNEKEINESLYDLAKEDSSLKDHLIITLSRPKITRLSELETQSTTSNNIEMITKCNKKKDEPYLFLEMPNGGERLDVILKSLFIENKDKFDLIIQKALDSLKVLHNLKKYHGDLHLGNFLVEENDTIKVRLIDFGFSDSIDENTNKSEKEFIDHIKERMIRINVPLSMSLIKTPPDFFKKLSEDSNIEYRLDLIQFLNSLGMIINNIPAGLVYPPAGIRKDFFMELLHEPLDGLDGKVGNFYDYNTHKDKLLL